MIQGFTAGFLPLMNALSRSMEDTSGLTLFTPDWSQQRVIHVQYEEDWTEIPVYVRFSSGTIQTIEEGIVTGCTHAGAKWGSVEQSTYYQSFDGFQEHEYQLEAYHCDHCPAWSYDQEDWNE